MELHKFRRLAGERIDARRLDVRIPVASHVAVVRIVDRQHDDVRFARRLWRLGGIERGQWDRHNGTYVTMANEASTAPVIPDLRCLFVRPTSLPRRARSGSVQPFGALRKPRPSAMQVWDRSLD